LRLKVLLAECGECALHPIRSYFHNGSLIYAGNIVARKSSDEQIGCVIKGHSSRPGKAGSKDALHAAWGVFVNKTATVVASAINGNEQVSQGAICRY
jgi:hypothetical protein